MIASTWPRARKRSRRTSTGTLTTDPSPKENASTPPTLESWTPSSMARLRISSKECPSERAVEVHDQHRTWSFSPTKIPPKLLEHFVKRDLSRTDETMCTPNNKICSANLFKSA